MKNQQLLYVALLTALATVFGIFENMLPTFFAFAPGAKIGLANLIILIALFTLNWRQVWTIQVLRLLFTALFGGFSVLLYSLVGAVLSLAAMYAMKKIGPSHVSLIGISVVGGFFHNTGQLLVASWIAQTPQVMLYLPALSLFGILAGFVIGLAGNLVIERIKPIHDLYLKKGNTF